MKILESFYYYSSFYKIHGEGGWRNHLNHARIAVILFLNRVLVNLSQLFQDPVFLICFFISFLSLQRASLF
jgi:hypothetical protein